MKTPLHYQISEYDCGPTSMLNAMSFLFSREELPPEILRNTMLYCLDCYGKEGHPGKSGTSCMAMMFLSNWLDGFGKAGLLPVSSRYLRGEEVFIGEGSRLNDTLCRKGVAVVRLWFEVEHYVLMTGVEDEEILLFDPYYQEEAFKGADSPVRIDLAHPLWYNRRVPFSFFNRETQELYALGKKEAREAVLLFNDATKLTAEKSIEYFI